MKFTKKSLLAVVAGSIAPITLSEAATVQIDFGIEATAAAGWNTMTAANAGNSPNDLTDAIDSTGAATTIDVTYAEFMGSDSGVAGTARNYAGPYPAPIVGQPADASRDIVFSRDSPIAFTFSDLDPNATYDFLIYGSTDRAGFTDYTVTGNGAGSTITLETQTNDTDVAVFTGIVPDSNNEIVLDVAGNNSMGVTRSFGAINTLVLTVNPVPEPSAAALGGLALLSLLRRRRSC